MSDPRDVLVTLAGARDAAKHQSALSQAAYFINELKGAYWITARPTIYSKETWRGGKQQKAIAEPVAG